MANDYFRFRQFTIRQEQCAMKVGTDGTLLGAWAGAPKGRTSQILDIGTGTGLIALMMAQRFPLAQLTAIDIDAKAAEQARQNAIHSPFGPRVKVVRDDVANLSGTFDAIVSNPPYFANSLHSPNHQRTLARHDDTLSYRKLMTCATQLLADDGELSVVVPTDQQCRLESEATLASLFKSRECGVKTSPRKPVRRVLLAFRKHPVPVTTALLTLGTPEALAMTHDFYL